MVAEQSSHDLTSFNSIVYLFIKFIRELRDNAILCVVMFGMATFVPPTPVFFLIAMIADHTTKKIIGCTMLHNWLIKVVNVTSPVCLIIFAVSHTATGPFPAAIFTAIAVFTFYFVQSLPILTFHSELPIPFILPALFKSCIYR